MAHSEETRDLAYQVWAFQAGQDVKRAAELLALEHTHDIPIRTLHDWVTRYKWLERVRQDRAAIAPGLHEQTVGELVFGAPSAARTLRRIVEDPAYVESLGRSIGGVINASIALLDRAGYSPLNRLKPRKVEAPKQLADSIDLDALSLAEVLALEAQQTAGYVDEARAYLPDEEG